MDYKTATIEYFNKNNIKYIQNYTIDYRCDTFVVDFYLPDSKTFIIFDNDNWAIDLYKDIQSLSKLNGFDVHIIPIYEINNINQLENYLLFSNN